MSYTLTEAERQWTPDEEYEEMLKEKEKEIKKADKKDFAHLQEELTNKIRQHVRKSSASKDLTNPEFL